MRRTRLDWESARPMRSDSKAGFADLVAGAKRRLKMLGVVDLAIAYERMLHQQSELVIRNAELQQTISQLRAAEQASATRPTLAMNAHEIREWLMVFRELERSSRIPNLYDLPVGRRAPTRKRRAHGRARR